METALMVVEAIIGIIVIIAILMQPRKSDALSGLVQGSSNETFYSKNKSRTKEVRLERLTIVGMTVFAVIALVLNII